ncbi:MAG TPA: M20/M25/M40 family metallo-hydrolase [Thermoplasmata archaeon]|nr:M20/M25/M40 family metallo-hydrolase [Thermoplasmata archaeon]
MSLPDILARVESGTEKSLETLKEYCRFPTISAHKRAQPETAAFVRRLLAEAGFEAREFPTEGGPNVVYGQMIVNEKKPTLLMYQHYDVQPVDPLDEWKRDPFDPVVEGDKFYARGCGDTKGNLVAQLLAVQAWKEADGQPPINLKFVVEGEEEVGSPHFRPFVEANKELLRADGATIEGGDHLHDGTPKVELGCKGTLYVDMIARTAKVDQHSMYAPIAPNPSWRLIHALNTLRNKDGKITIPGWYEDARRPSARELRYLRASGFKAQSLKEFWGARELLGGDNDFEILRRLIYWPTCTICGFLSGYTGEGTKTVNPAVARAKVDFRLVPNMKVGKQLQKLKDHLKAKGFEDIQLEYADSLEASAIPISARVVKAAVKGCVDAFGREPEVWPWSAGASANAFFNEIVGAPSISGPGVSYDGSNYHAPNENIRISDFVMGAKHMAAMIGRF